MPRRILGDQAPRARHPHLVEELANELRSDETFGQPMIHEQRFSKTNVVRTTVIWDMWESLSDEDRLAVILQAYAEVEGEDFRDRLALAIGLTIPEAHEAGLLPFQVTIALRPTDPVTKEQCLDAMIALGASVLSNPERPILCFATVEEAEQCVQQLVERLPDSKPVWVVREEAVRAME